MAWRWVTVPSLLVIWATPSALTLSANEVLYKPAAGTLAGLAVGRKTLLTGGATPAQAVSIAAGSIVAVDAGDIIGLSIPAKSIPYTDSGTGLLAALSVRRLHHHGGASTLRPSMGR